MSGVPYTFGTATTSIPLSNLDSNFVTPVTIGNASVALGNTITAIGNLTLNNVTINSGTINASVSETYSLANAVVYSNSSNVGVTSSNLTFDGTTLTANTIKDSALTSGRVTYATTGGLLTDSANFVFDGTNVGIGTTTMTGKLNVNATGANSRIAIGDTAASTYSTVLMYGGSGKYNFQLSVQNNVNNAFEITPSTAAGGTTFSTPAMVIDSSGSVGIGVTPDTNYYLTVQSVSNDTKNAIKVNQASTGNRTQISFNNPNGAVGSITTNGSATLYNTTSDYRLKTVIGSVSDAGTRIDALEPIEYDWNNGGGRTKGFLAHKFAEVYPNSVSGEKDAVDAEGKPVYQAMQASSSEVMADLVAEIQSLRKRVAQLESK
jgi:hypothetical protein